jgi:hypothetical protein
MDENASRRAFGLNLFHRHIRGCGVMSGLNATAEHDGSGV